MGFLGMKIGVITRGIIQIGSTKSMNSGRGGKMGISPG